MNEDLKTLARISLVREHVRDQVELMEELKIFRSDLKPHARAGLENMMTERLAHFLSTRWIRVEGAAS
jgi:hypothetical protein